VEGRATTVPALAEGLPCNFWSFRDCFVIFRLCYSNFNVIFLFICLEIVFCIVDVKKKRKEKKGKIIIEKEICVCLCFFLCMLLNQKEKNEFNILFYMHNYLKDI
jgi:hypothetical protein